MNKISGNSNPPFHLQSRIGFDRFSFLVFCLIAIELMIGGGGRLTAFGPISLRMALFGVASLLTIVHMLRGKKLPTDFIRLMIIISGVLAAGVLIGWWNGSSRAAWWEDIKPLLYLFMIPFFYFSVVTREDVRLTTTMIRWSALFLSISFFVVLILINTGAVPFLKFYHLLLPTQEFFFRGEISFVYKGFIYIGVGVLFWHLLQPNKTVIALLVLALVFSFTRGFVLSLLFTYALYYGWQYFMYRKTKLILVSIGFFVGGTLVVLQGQKGISLISETIDYARVRLRQSINANDTTRFTHNSRLLGDREYSDTRRLLQIKQVEERVTPGSILWGHGFGQGIPERPVHMEISYLEIFHKQGLIGLTFWCYVTIMIIRRFRQCLSDPLAAPLLLAIFYILIQSFVNQYINNPIGISVVLLALVGLERLRTSQKPVNKTVTGTFSK